jgi:HTH-type transcriptional regulator / antitoxin HigA
MQTISFQPFIEFNAVVGGIRPATTESEYERLIALMQDLTDQYNPDDARVMALFDILAQYILQYEEIHFDFPSGTATDVLRHLMTVHNVSQTDLAREGIASQGQLSNVLAERRGVSKVLAQKLANRFLVPLETFL